MKKFKDNVRSLLVAYTNGNEKEYESMSVSTLSVHKKEILAAGSIGFLCLLTIISKLDSNVPRPLIFALIMFSISIPLHVANALLIEGFEATGNTDKYITMIKSKIYLYALTSAWISLFIGISFMLFNFSSLVGIIFIFSSIWAGIFYFVCYARSYLQGT